MNFRGRNLDPVAFWSRYVEFPANLKLRADDEFLPKVVCPNPEHDTLKSHFQINVHQGTVHCFAHCGISGSYEHAVCVVEGLYEKFKVDEAKDEKERKRRTAKARRFAGKQILGVARGASDPKEILERTRARKSKPITTVPNLESSFESFLPPVAREYLTERGITSESIAKWEIGWHPEDRRIVIPIRDENGHMRLLVKRGVFSKQNPKYLYWPEKDVGGWGKTDLLFGLDKIDPGMVRSFGLVLQEGSIGAILNHQHGLDTTVAILGTGISDRQVEAIARVRPKRIYFMFDKDLAGIRNIEIAAKKLRKYPCFVVKFPKGCEDWDEVNAKRKMRQIERAVPVFKFLNSLGLGVSSNRKEVVSLG